MTLHINQALRLRPQDNVSRNYLLQPILADSFSVGNIRIEYSRGREFYPSMVGFYQVGG